MTLDETKIVLLEIPKEGMGTKKLKFSQPDYLKQTFLENDLAKSFSGKDNK